MFLSFSSQICFRQSSVFLANRLIDFMIIISILPAYHAVEFITLFGIVTANSIVRKYSRQLPFQIFLNELSEMLHLHLVATYLFFLWTFILYYIAKVCNVYLKVGYGFISYIKR